MKMLMRTNKKNEMHSLQFFLEKIKSFFCFFFLLFSSILEEKRTTRGTLQTLPSCVGIPTVDVFQINANS